MHFSVYVRTVGWMIDISLFTRSEVIVIRMGEGRPPSWYSNTTWTKHKQNRHKDTFVLQSYVNITPERNI